MARSFPKNKRNTVTRRQKPLILIIAEGQNVTESADQEAGKRK